MQNIIEVRDLVKRFGETVAVNSINFTVNEGEIFGLLGPNGAGKTTTLRMLMRILIPDEGSIQILGEPLSAETQDRLGYLPEERGLYPRMQVRKLLVFLGALKGLTEREANRRARDWLERLGLAAWSEKKVIDLSKGMQQKVQFIAAVIHRPPLLILDEPFTGLDPINAVVVKDIMMELRDQGSTIILSTHRMEQVEMMCDSICLMNQGRNILDGELQAIKKSLGKNTVRIECSGDGDFLRQMPALVQCVSCFGAVIEAKLRPGADPQEILKTAVDQGVRITRFELMEPPLNDIFIERVSSPHA